MYDSNNVIRLSDIHSFIVDQICELNRPRDYCLAAATKEGDCNTNEN